MVLDCSTPNPGPSRYNDCRSAQRAWLDPFIGRGAVFDAGAICGLPPWSDVTGRICRTLPARVVGMFVHYFAQGREGGEIRCAEGIPEPFIEAYRRASPGNPWFAAMRGVAPNSVLAGVDLLPSWELVRTGFYRDWLRPQNLRHALIGEVLRDAEQALFIVALRAPSQAPFGSSDMQTVGLVLPALGSVAQIGTELGSIRNLADDLVRVLEMCPDVLMVVDQEAHPLILNLPARRLLERADGLLLRAGVLAAGTKEETTMLRSVIAQAEAPNEARRPDATACGRVMIRRSSGVGPLLLEVRKLPCPVADHTGCAKPVVAVLARPPEGEEVEFLFRHHYGLTPAEARLGEMIASGKTLLQAAAELGISRNTARTHMKRVYMKTDTGRQVELVRLVGAGGLHP